MKVCFVVNEIEFFLSAFFELIKEISIKHKVILISDMSNAKPEDYTKIEEAGIQIISLKKRSKSASIAEYLFYLNELRKEIKKCSPEQIFFITLELSIFGALINNFIKVKKIFFLITGTASFYSENNFKTIFVRAVIKASYLFLIFNKNFKFIFQNKDDMDIFMNKKISNQSNSILIKGLGINTKEFPFFERNEKQELTFLFAARLLESKGFNEFLEAGKEIMKKYPKTNFIAAGKLDFENPETISEKTYESLTKSGIHFLGEVPHEKMKNLYKNATIFVLPSYREGLPQAALEAASTGMPLILTDVPGCRECVTNNLNGYLVRERDSNDLMSKMEKFILNPEIIKLMSKSSRKIIEKQFSVNHVSHEYLKSIHEQN
jgi:glycosyltransferase involved in cell wall biosynthesis